MSDRSTITQRIFRRVYSRGLLRIDEAVSMVAPAVLECNQIEALSYAEANKRHIWKRLVERIDEERNKGLHPTFRVVDTNRYEFAWFPKLAESDPSSLKQKKLRLSYRGRILDYLDTVDSRQYEAVGGVICILAGANRWHLTDPGNEFGVDFLAVLPAYGSSHLFPHANKQIRLVGQSKKWQSPIKRDQVDLLANTLDNIRRKHTDIFEKVLPHWFVSAKGLLVGCMISHSGAQVGGSDRAHEHGIIMADSRDIAEVVALSRAWEVGQDRDRVIRFLDDQIDEVLQEHQQRVANEH